MNLYETTTGLPVKELLLKHTNIANSGTLADDATYTATIPVKAGQVVTAVSVKLIEAFDDSGSGDELDITVGDGSDADGYIESAALHTDQSEITYVYNTGDYFLGEAGTTDPENVTNGKLYTADDTIDIVLTPNGSTGDSYSLNELTAGEALVKVWYLDLN